MRTLRRSLPSALSAVTLFAVWSCDSSQVTSGTAGSTDRIIPTVSLATNALKAKTGGRDSINVRTSLSVTVTAKDNAALASVITKVIAGTSQIAVDTAPATSLGSNVNRTFAVPLAAVAAGQELIVSVIAMDGGGNEASAAASVMTFDPFVPEVKLVATDGSAIPGGTYRVTVVATDSLGITKLGFKASATQFSVTDSILRVSSLLKRDSAVFTMQVPPSMAVGSSFNVAPFAENRDGLRANGATLNVRIVAPGPDVVTPLVFQTVPARLEEGDLIEVTGRDADGLVRIIGFMAKDSAGNTLYRAADTLAAPVQQITRKKAFAAPSSLRGRGLFIVGYATDQAGHTGYSVSNGSTVPVTSDSSARRDPMVYAYGRTALLPAGSLGADIAVDTVRKRVFVSNLNKNELEVFTYGATMTPEPAVSVGSMPWGMTLDNSGSLLLVANSGGTNISKVSLLSLTETGRVKTSNEYLFDVTYSVVEAQKDSSGNPIPGTSGFKFGVTGPFDYSDRPQFIAQSASGALYYSTRPTSASKPGTLRRLDNFLDARSEPRQIWQYGSVARGHWVVINADWVYRQLGTQSAPDSIILCDHPVGSDAATASVCVVDGDLPGAVQQLRTQGANVDAILDLDIESLALPDTNFVAVGGDRRRVAFGEGNTGGRVGRVILVDDPTGTVPGMERYSPGIEVIDLTNNASDRIFGLAINGNSTNIAVHGVETFFADSALRLQGKFATFNTGAGVAFHPRNNEENTADLLARVAFVASGDNTIQIVDSYSYRLRGRLPIRGNLYGPLRAVEPTSAQKAADPTLVVKLFGLTPEGLVVIDIHQNEIDNVINP
jgi:hypothetical protein